MIRQWDLCQGATVVGTIEAEYIRMHQPGLVELFNRIHSLDNPNVPKRMEHEEITKAVIVLAPGQYLSLRKLEGQ